MWIAAASAIPEMNRLLLITENYPPDRGGMSESCDRITRGLARAGAGLEIVHFDRRAGQHATRRTGSGSITRVPSDADAAHAVNLLWNHLQQNVELEAVTHVIAFGGTLPILCGPAFAAWIKRPLVTLIRGNELDAGLFDPRRRPMLDDAFRRSAAIGTVTTGHAEKIAALHPETEPRVIANGVDFELWHATDTDHARAQRWRDETVAAGRRVLGFFGHLKNKKGVPAFVSSLIRSGVADRFHLLFVGEVEPSLQEALSADAAIAATVLPPVDRFDLLPFYLASDLVVLPSHYDGFPNVLIEAAALSRPLLASDIGGMRDLLVDGEHAFLFAPGDEASCRDAIARSASATDRELQGMGASAAGAAREHCDARQETRRYLDLLCHAEEVFDGKHASARRSHAAAAHGL